MELWETVDGMTSKDYKDRFRSEYNQLCIRIEKLVNVLYGYKNGLLAYTPSCSYELLHKQLIDMERYKQTLEERAKVENVPLRDSEGNLIPAQNKQ